MIGCFVPATLCVVRSRVVVWLPCVLTIISPQDKKQSLAYFHLVLCISPGVLGLDAYSRSQLELELSETYSGTVEKIFILKFPPILTIQCVYY